MAELGSGFLFASLLIAVQSQVGREDVAAATSAMSFIQNMTLALSVVAGGTRFLNSIDQQICSLRDASLPQNLLHELSKANAIASIVIGRGLSDIFLEPAINNAFTWAISSMCILYPKVGLLGMVSSFLLRRCISQLITSRQ